MAEPVLSSWCSTEEAEQSLLVLGDKLPLFYQSPDKETGTAQHCLRDWPSPTSQEKGEENKGPAVSVIAPVSVLQSPVMAPTLTSQRWEDSRLLSHLPPSSCSITGADTNQTVLLMIPTSDTWGWAAGMCQGTRDPGGAADSSVAIHSSGWYEARMRNARFRFL